MYVSDRLRKKSSKRPLYYLRDIQRRPTLFLLLLSTDRGGFDDEVRLESNLYGSRTDGGTVVRRCSRLGAGPARWIQKYSRDEGARHAEDAVGRSRPARRLVGRFGAGGSDGAPGTVRRPC